MRFSVGVVLAAVALVAVACTAAFMVGQQTRMADSEVTVRLASAVEKRSERADREQEEALSEQAARFQRRLARVRKVSRNRGYRVGKKSGYQEGNNDGYAAGNSAGYSSGHSVGVDEGVDKASDSLTCSDDPDAGLPPCWIYDY
jgi:flagellar biosynthesis/type III secretory pathway protein FliH